MLLFFDTETNGLPDFDKRASDPTQPHIIQLAATITDEDGTVFESHNVLVKPEGWVITPEMTAIHGISMVDADLYGLPEKVVAEILMNMIKRSRLIVAHNIQFDKFMARIMFRRTNLLLDANDLWWKGLPTFCTMHATTDLCRLPGKFPGKYKWPKLGEAYAHFFKRPLINAHDALADVTACADIYFYLKQTRPELGLTGAAA